jgi:hypothetical protein
MAFILIVKLNFHLKNKHNQKKILVEREKKNLVTMAAELEGLFSQRHKLTEPNERNSANTEKVNIQQKAKTFHFNF